MQNAEGTNLKQFLEKTYGQNFSEKEVQQSKDKITGFFELLIRIDRRQKRKELINDEKV